MKIFFLILFFLSLLITTLFAQLNVSVNNRTICYGTATTLTATASGGTLPYSYSWNIGQTKSTITVSPTITTTYIITVTDNTPSTATAQAVVTVSPQMFASITRTDATCGFPNASATVTATGGIPYPSPPYYTYLWSPGGYTADIISNVSSGSFSVTVTDAIGCKVTATTTILDTPPVTLSTSQTPTNCFPNGTATVNVLTGTPPYNYTWSTVPPQYTQTATGINSGQYCVTVIDAKGCSNASCVTVLESNPLSITISTTPEHCGQMDGTATANPAGGNPALSPYTFEWTNGETTQTITDLAQGSYCVTVTYGTCLISTCVAVIEKIGPNADFSCTPAAIDILENPTAVFYDLSTPGGQPIVAWHWDFGDNNSTADIKNPAHTYIFVGIFTVCLKVTDSANCMDSICKPVIVTLYPKVNKDILFNVNPNPFGTQAEITYTLYTRSNVKLEVFDVTGRKVSTICSGEQNDGEYKYYFPENNIGLKSGIYIFRLKVNDEIVYKKIVGM